MTIKPFGNDRGFMLVMSIILLLVLSIMIPSLVNWVRQESKDTVKVKRSTGAFHMAEAGVDQGMWKLQESQTTWSAAKAGTTIADYDGNTQFTSTMTNGKTGRFTVKFTAGPSTGQVTILAKGQDDTTMEVRAVEAVLQENGAGEYSIQAKKSSSFGAATSVEWGPIVSKISIDSGGKNHPRLYSAGDITGKDANGSSSPNTDNVQWWSYKADLPADPSIDFNFYKSSAQAAGSAPNGCGSASGATYYRVGNASFRGCTDLTDNVYYITGNCNFATGGGGNKIQADIICLGDLSVTGNGGGDLDKTLSVPSEAWEEYGNDWAYYTTNFDSSCPHATYAAAVAADYAPTGLTKAVTDIIVHGFLYTGGSQGLTGGGNGVLVGTLYSANSATMATSNCTLYFDPDTAEGIQTTNVIVSRVSWKEVVGLSFP